MQSILIYFFIAVGLSMDAFSLALAYGINNLPIQKSLLLSIIVGIFHFIMPTLGSFIGFTFFSGFVTKADTIVAIVFIVLAIQMYLSKDDEEKVMITNLLSMLAFATTVSIDSFSVGVALSLTEKSITIACLIFSMISSIFTFLGLTLGKKISEKFGSKATYLGIIILLLLALKYII